MKITERHRKVAHHHSLYEKWKSKPLSSIISYWSDWVTELYWTELNLKYLQYNCWRQCGEKETFLHCWWECKLVQPLWRTLWRLLRKLQIEVPYGQAILLMGMKLKGTRIERNTTLQCLLKDCLQWLGSESNEWFSKWMIKEVVVLIHMKYKG